MKKDINDSRYWGKIGLVILLLGIGSRIWQGEATFFNWLGIIFGATLYVTSD